MTVLELNQYKAIKYEIKDINERINKLKNDSTEMRTDKVTGSSAEYPFCKRNFTITGIDLKANNRRVRKLSELIEIREAQREKLIEREKMIEEFIESIPESKARQIFRFCYIDGLTQEKAAKKAHIDQSVVSRIISKYLKNA